MHLALSPGLVLAALALITTACSPLSPTHSPLPDGGMRTATAPTGALLGNLLPAPAASALALVPMPTLPAQSLPKTALSGPPAPPAGLPPSQPSAVPPVATAQAMLPPMPSVAAVTAPGTSLPGSVTTWISP